MSETFAFIFDRSLFTINLLIICSIFLIPLEKRKNLLLRIAAGCIFCLCLSLLFPHTNLKYIIELAAAAFYVYFVCDITPQDAAYCAVLAYATQHFAHALYLFLFRASRGAPQLTLSYLFSCAVPYIAFYFLFVRKLPENGRYNVDIKFSLVSTALVLVFALWLSDVAGSYFAQDNSQLYYVCKAYAMLCCFFVLWVQRAQREKLKVQRELDLQQQLWTAQKSQYEIARKNIDLINRKCHDLKHHVNTLRTVIPDYQRERYLSEIERSIQIYDSTVETGSEVLNTVLTEKSLYCEGHQISMTCVADGAQLHFLDAVDVYTIFGNAIDNAIESVITVEDTSRRFIAVSVWSKSDLLLIQFENYYEGRLELENGLPVTTKPDKDYHGFGLRSIRYTVEKYDGCMGIYPENNIFLLRISIPIP